MEHRGVPGLPHIQSLARQLVYGKQPQEQNKDKGDVASDPELDPKDVDETTDADDEANGATCKDKVIHKSLGLTNCCFSILFTNIGESSKMRPPQSRAKRTRSRSTDASTSITTRWTRSRPEMSSPKENNHVVGEEPAENTQSPTDTTPREHQTSKDSNSPDGNSDTATQSDAIVALQGQVASSSGGNGQIAKRKGRRRPTMGHGLQDYTRRNGKMQIKFTEGKLRPEDPLHAAKLSSECGIMVRRKLHIPMHWKEFKNEGLQHAIPNAIKAVAGKFEMDRNDEVAKGVCTNILQKSIRQQRCRLKRDYFKGRTVEQTLANKPPNMTLKNWTKLVHNFADERYQELCEKNQQNRAGVKHRHKTGSRCYVAHRNSLKEKYNNEEPGPIHFFKESHTKMKDGTMIADALEAYTRMDDLRTQCQSEGGQPRSDVEIVQEVMKEKSTSSTYLATLCYSSTSRRSTSSTSSVCIQELEARLEQQEKEARAANEKHEHELTSRLEAQQGEIEELKRRQQEELESLKKTQQEQSQAFEKKQQEMDTLIGYLLRKQNEPSNK